MQIKERTKKQINEKIGGMSEFLKIEYLEECLKAPITFDVKKFVQEILIELYQQRKMYSQAARHCISNAEISLRYVEKIEQYVKAVKLYVKAGMLNEADISYRKSLACGNAKEKKEIEGEIVRYYWEQAEKFEKQNKRAHAVKIYEKLFQILKDENQKTEAKKKIIEIYEKMGRIKEAIEMKRSESSKH